MIFLLLVVLICTLIGSLVGHPGWGLAIGFVLAVLFGYFSSKPY